MKNAALSMTVTSPSLDGADDLDPEIIMVLDESDLIEADDDFVDEAPTDVYLDVTIDDDFADEAPTDVLLLDVTNPYARFAVPSDSAIVVVEPTEEDEVNLASEAALIGEWVDAYAAGDSQASIYETWLAGHPSAHPGRFPVTLAV